MALLFLFELVLVFSAILGLLTQIVVPVINGTRVFPMFRRDKSLEKQLEQVREHAEDTHLKREIKKEKEKIKSAS